MRMGVVYAPRCRKSRNAASEAERGIQPRLQADVQRPAAARGQGCIGASGG
jgi:hypothetical protein